MFAYGAIYFSMPIQRLWLPALHELCLILDIIFAYTREVS